MKFKKRRSPKLTLALIFPWVLGYYQDVQALAYPSKSRSVPQQLLGQKPPTLLPQNPSKRPTRKPLLRLIGTQEPQINVIKGAQWGTENLQRIFKDESWIFYPDGKFTFTPSLNANLRSDLYPISGTYKQANNIWEFRGENQSSGASTSVDGTVRSNGDKLILDVIYTVAALDSQKIANISQSFEQQSESSSRLGADEIQEIPIISVFAISFERKTETQRFGPISGMN